MPRGRRLRRWLILALPLLAIAGVLGYRAWRPVTIEVEPVTRGRAVEAVYATGTVEPIVKVTVKARLAEHVASIHAREGDPITKGQLLARIENPVGRYALSQGQTLLTKARHQAGTRSPQLAGLDATARALGAQLALAKLDLGRSERLAATQAIPIQELDAARYRLVQLQAQADAAEQQARSAHLELAATRDQLASEVRSLASAVDEGAVLSPIGGVVLRRAIEPGEVVAQNQALFEIADTSVLLVELHVDEADIARIEDGARGSQVALSFYAFPGRAFDGKVTQILPEPDRVRRSYTVRVGLAAPIPGLRVGMTAEANIIVQRKDGVLLLPVEALVGDHAWFIENGRAVRRPVRIGIRGLTHAELVTGAGAGAMAVVDPARTKLHPGTRVEQVVRTVP